MTDTPDLIFEEPPPSRGNSGRGGSPVALWLASLREHPGQWAVMEFPDKPQTHIGKIMANIKRGTGYGARPGEFDAATRKRGDGSALYARYVGGES